ncbi:ATP-binding protein [Paenibacillus doosanensis]|uniref:histidine kinase n=1 Tax=Paenibacillus konkukensis TaxID=2020716 RepID=A0ABY4RWZ7_9BACL|nr:MULTISPECIES: ATP-binding protein [Paenibacillus]MCS7458787.1 ATP-binding protein [Paenibacillus doosanensis]UQZ86687.1 Alkaline phosphatase synthesis sensor protein PhoR [Paenibacillus konkukensis]
MKNNPYFTIRWKIIQLIFWSALSSVVTVYVMYKFVELLLLLYKNNRFIYGVVRILYDRYGIQETLITLGIVCFILYLIVFSQRTVAYLARIMNTVHQMSHGNFDLTIPEKSRGELGELAESINRMSRQLKVSLAEERLAVQTKNELITNVSHDLRTPLTSVIGYLRLIEEDRYRDEVELRYYVNIAYEKSLRLGRMVSDLFEYTRMSHGDGNLRISEINLVELLGQLSAEFSLQLHEKRIEIMLHTKYETMLVRADGDKLMRVFENLIANAIKYGQDGKRIDIELRRAQDRAVVRIINYGPPIPAVDLPHIFERFYRVEKSRSDETGGTGLGLAIAKSIVDMHNGTMDVASSEERTVFEVQLPIHAAR